jgi:cell division protein FtsL
MIQAQSYARNAEGLDRSEQQARTAMVRRTYTRVNGKRVVVVKAAVLLFAYALVLVYLCIKSATLGYQIVDLEKQIDNLETSNKRIEYQIATETSLQRVEKVAVKELGMYKPDTSSVLQIAAQPEPVKTTEASGGTVSKQHTAGSSILQKTYQTIAKMSR